MTTINSLPKDPFLLIFKYFKEEELTPLLGVCKLWKERLEKDELWMPKCLKKWPNEYPSKNLTWKEWHLIRSPKRNFIYKNNRAFLTTNNYIRGWERMYGNWSLVSSTKNEHSGPFMAFCVGGNNEEPVLYTGSSDKTIKVWKKDDASKSFKVAETLEEHTDAVTALCLRKKILWSGSANSTIRIWNLGKEKDCHIVEGHKGAITCLQPNLCKNSNELQFFSGSVDKTVKIWKKIGDKIVCIQTLKEHHGAITCLALSLHDNLLFSGSEDGTVCIWNGNYSKWKLEKKIKTHTGPIQSICFHQFNGNVFIASGNEIKIGKRFGSEREWKQLGKTYKHSEKIEAIEVGSSLHYNNAVEVFITSENKISILSFGNNKLKDTKRMVEIK